VKPYRPPVVPHGEKGTRGNGTVAASEPAAPGKALQSLPNVVRRSQMFCADYAGQLLASRHKKSPLAVPTSCDGAMETAKRLLDFVGSHTQRNQHNLTTATTARSKGLTNFHLFNRLSHGFVPIGCYPTVYFNGFAKPNSFKSRNLAGSCQP